MKRTALLGLAAVLVLLASSVYGYDYIKCDDYEEKLSPTSDYYCVKKGDTLTKILNIYVKEDWTVDELAQKNDILNKNLIYAKQKIIISEEGLQALQTEEKTKPEAGKYIVQKDDNFWSIWIEQDLWDKYGLSFSEFKEINKDVLKISGNFGHIEPGQELLIQKDIPATTIETILPPPRFLEDDTNSLGPHAQEIIDSAQNLFEDRKITIYVKTIEEATQEDVEEITITEFTDMETKLDRKNLMNLVITLVKKYEGVSSAIFLTGYRDSEGGIVNAVINEVDTQKMKNDLQNAKTDEEIGKVVVEVTEAVANAIQNLTLRQTDCVEPTAEELIEYVDKYSGKYGVEKAHILAIMGAESTFIHCNETSRKVLCSTSDPPSCGIMQIWENNAKATSTRPAPLAGIGIDNPEYLANAEKNIHAGVYLLDTELDKFVGYDEQVQVGTGRYNCGEVEVASHNYCSLPENKADCWTKIEPCIADITDVIKENIIKVKPSNDYIASSLLPSNYKLTSTAWEIGECAENDMKKRVCVRLLEEGQTSLNPVASGSLVAMKAGKEYVMHVYHVSDENEKDIYDFGDDVAVDIYAVAGCTSIANSNTKSYQKQLTCSQVTQSRVLTSLDEITCIMERVQGKRYCRTGETIPYVERVTRLYECYKDCLQTKGEQSPECYGMDACLYRWNR